MASPVRARPRTSLAGPDNSEQDAANQAHARRARRVSRYVTKEAPLSPALASVGPAITIPSPITPPRPPLGTAGAGGPATADFLVIGSGIAGLSFALKAAQHGSVAVVTKGTLREGCTVYAQGGVCAVLDPLDSVSAHATDTMVAGCHLNDERAVNVVCGAGAARVLELAELGASFTTDACSAGGALHLTREGGHSHRRIVHAADATGAEIARALEAAVLADPRVRVYEGHMLIDLVTSRCEGAPHCFGADTLEVATGAVRRFTARATLLATGGAGHLYPSTTNPAVATGDGIAAAWRAGTAVANMEFVQFHPTAFFDGGTAAAGGHGGDRALLITEAVRGEGGVLLNFAGERFMPSYDRRAELAPRDVVARAITDQMRRRGEPHVWLDISHRPAEFVLAHFPTVAARCAERGVDVTCQPIPVLPAQHYLCGGVATGLRGETAVAGLFAVGEVACTGLHGANRLASNSLLEGLVFADRAVAPAAAHVEHAAAACAGELAAAARSTPALRRGAAGAAAAAPPRPRIAAWLAGARREVQELMWAAAGIERTGAGIAAGLSRLDALEADVGALVATTRPTRAALELRNLATCARLVLESAAAREESRGLHFRSDFPRPSPHAVPTILQPEPGVGVGSAVAARGGDVALAA